VYRDGKPSPAALAKQLFAQHVRYGDHVYFPANRLELPALDAIVARAQNGRLSAVFVNSSQKAVTVVPQDIVAELESCDSLFRLDTTTGERVVAEKHGGPFTLNGYGIGVITNDGSQTIFD
jgi:hypothetical protein